MSGRGGVSRALVIGGGFSGMTAALKLREAGIAVDLVEIDPQWRSYGAGISLHGAALRVMRQVGIYERFLEVGAVGDGVDMRSAQDDTVLVTLPTPSVGDGLPGGGAVLRPILAGLLRDRVRESGTEVRLGGTFTEIVEAPEGVRVTFDDGTRATYDLVVGADGINSATRRALFPEAPRPRFVGQAVWRAVLPRPAEIQRPTMWISGPIKAGLNLVSRETVYLFLTENRAANDHVSPSTFVPALSALLERFPSPILTKARETLGAHSQIVYRPLEQFLLRRPWHRGRVVLIGDAVHATTPHLAAGACIGMEDAIVLGESVAAHDALEDGLAAFEERRWERCRMVVENSGRLGEIEVDHGDPQEHAAIMRSSMKILAEAV